VAHALEEVRAAKPDAVILAGPYAPLAGIVKQSHAQGWRPLFVTISFVGTEAFINAAGRDAEGIVITQVVPTYDHSDLPAVKLYRDCLNKYMSSTQPSFVSLEAFLNAMVIVEALKRAGSNPTRAGFMEALESMSDFDIGLGHDVRVELSPHRHKGLGHVYPTVVRGGRPEAFSDWASVLGPKIAQK